MENVTYYAIRASREIIVGSGINDTITHDNQGREYFSPVAGEVLRKSNKPIAPFEHYTSYTTNPRDGVYMVKYYVWSPSYNDGEAMVTYTTHYTAEGAKAASEQWASANGITAEAKD